MYLPYSIYVLCQSRGMCVVKFLHNWAAFVSDCPSHKTSRKDNGWISTGASRRQRAATRRTWRSRSEICISEWKIITTPNIWHGTRKGWWFVDVSPFPKGVSIFRFQLLVFEGFLSMLSSLFQKWGSPTKVHGFPSHPGKLAGTFSAPVGYSGGKNANLWNLEAVFVGYEICSLLLGPIVYTLYSRSIAKPFFVLSETERIIGYLWGIVWFVRVLSRHLPLGRVAFLSSWAST